MLGLIGTAAFYGAYAWIAVSAIKGAISLGQMTMYLLLFKQGQSAVSASLSAISGMYEDNLYLSNLYEYLEQPVPAAAGRVAAGAAAGGRGALRSGQLLPIPAARSRRCRT